MQMTDGAAEWPPEIGGPASRPVSTPEECTLLGNKELRWRMGWQSRSWEGTRTSHAGPREQGPGAHETHLSRLTRGLLVFTRGMQPGTETSTALCRLKPVAHEYARTLTQNLASESLLHSCSWQDHTYDWWLLSSTKKTESLVEVSIYGEISQ